jgi:WD40 repeat protein
MQIPHVLFSGSWDGCMRVWDVRNEGVCVRVVLDHHADIYDICKALLRLYYGSITALLRLYNGYIKALLSRDLLE